LALARIGRRAFLALSVSPLLHGQSVKGAVAVYAPQQFLDPATEFDLFRLTDPRFSAWLSAPHLHVISRRGKFLVHSSDRAGTMQAYRLDWRSGQSRQLTSAAALDKATPALTLDDRSMFHFDGRILKQVTMASLRERKVAEVPEGWDRAPGFSLSADGGTALWVEGKGERSRLQASQTASGNVRTVVETAGRISDPQIRPGHPQAAYRMGEALRIVNLDGVSDKELKTEPGRSVGQALWSPDGQTLLYLSISAERTQSITLREVVMETGNDRMIAKTSQFASFGVNGDSSVFVGASRSLASPYLLLLLRSVRRELTLCEHRASNPAAVNPVFSPDSQSIFFTSDRRGKSCIYRAHVEKFVEETDEGSGDGR
jgi:oligogalacturonide lyase